MASLISIPEELRDHIVELVLTNERDQPSATEAQHSDRAAITRTSREGTLSWGDGPKNVLYETTPTIPSSHGLLLVNKHLHKQTTQALSRLFPHGLDYKLDVLFLNESILHPTWLSVPARRNQINTINVTIRTFGRNTNTSRNAFRGGDGSGPGFVWMFYWLLQHFLACGVSTVDVEASRRKAERWVEQIKLDLVSLEPQLTPEDTEEAQSKWWRHQRRLSRGNSSTDAALIAAGKPARMHPRWLAEYLSRMIGGLAGMSYHMAAYGGLLHERVGKITVCSHGEVVREVGFGDVLARLAAGPEVGSDWYTKATFGHLVGECRVLTFWNWKYRAVLLRRSRGLSVGAPVAWPTLQELKGWRRARDEHRSTDRQGWYGTGSCGEGGCLCQDRRLEEMLERELEAGDARMD